MQLYTCYRNFFQNLEPQTLVLTPNQRLSRFVAQQWDAFHQRSDQHAWPALNCQAWQQWCRNQHLMLGLPGLWLEDQQCSLVWQQCVEALVGDAPNREALMGYARSGFDRARLWQLKPHELDDGSAEGQLLAGLTEAYCRRLRSDNWLDLPAGLQQLINAVEQGAQTIEHTVVLLGFDDISPLLESLFNALANAGVTVTSQDLALESKIIAGSAQDEQEELKAAIRWASDKLTAAGEHKSELRIGLVIPDLARLRPLVERLLMREFEPGYAHPEQGRHAPGYNISAGQPLAQTSMVAAGLELLSLLLGALPATRIAALTHSPFLWPALGLSSRTKAASLATERYIELNLRQWCALLSEITDDCDPGLLLHRLQALREALQSVQGRKRSHRDWAKWFHERLCEMGWPGQRKLDTLEFQQYQSWCDTCGAFARLDLVEDSCDLACAFARFKKAFYIPFLPQTGASPLQVLGLLEASGLHFDALWVTGLSDELWPPPCEPNPLLPAALQKQKGLPRASVHREFALAEKITNRFRNAAREVIFSWPAWQGDEPLRPSTLIAPLLRPEQTLASNTDAPSPVIEVPHNALEYIPDSRGPGYPGREVRGGSALLRDQGACPFRAFARHRLAAINPELKEPGIRPLLRGNLIHAALEHFWRRTQSFEGLCELSDERLHQRIVEAVQRTWVGLTKGEYGDKTEAIETDRACRLIHKWLELEKTRSAFVVDASEQDATGQLGPLSLQTRMDRLDRLTDGSAVIIDYKTGRTDPKQWFGPRPDEPQVPLYAVLQQQVTAAVFAELSFKEVAAKGVAANAEVWPELASPAEVEKFSDAPDWPSLLLRWRTDLGALAEEFHQGVASVTPKGPNSCLYCDLHSLCRVWQTSGSEPKEDEDAAE